MDSESEQLFIDAYDAANEAWFAGDYQSFIDFAGVANETLMGEGLEPLNVDDWYDIDSDELQDFIDNLSHEDREAFFGY